MQEPVSAGSCIPEKGLRKLGVEIRRFSDKKDRIRLILLMNAT
jgi:hypothetical protein